MKVKVMGSNLSFHLKYVLYLLDCQANSAVLGSSIQNMRVYKRCDPITYRICTVYFLLDRKTFGFYGSFTTTLSTNTHHPCLSHAVTSLLLILNRPKRIDLRKKGRKKKKIHQFLIAWRNRSWNINSDWKLISKSFINEKFR